MTCQQVSQGELTSDGFLSDQLDAEADVGRNTETSCLMHRRLICIAFLSADALARVSSIFETLRMISNSKFTSK